MRITKKWLKEKSARADKVKWFLAQKETDGVKVVKKLMTGDKLRWANWLIVRLMNHKKQIKYAIFVAEQVIDIYEKKYPNDKRPRNAIEAAKKYLENPSEEKKKAAYAAAYDAANVATNAAYVAVYVAADAANAAADAANAAANTVGKEIKIKIINYGLELLQGAKNAQPQRRMKDERRTN